MERLPGNNTLHLTGLEPVSSESEGADLAEAAAGETEDDDGDWEDCSEDAENEASEQQKLEAMLMAK